MNKHADFVAGAQEHCEGHLRAAVESVERTVGHGSAQRCPELVGAFLVAAVLDQHLSGLRRTVDAMARNAGVVLDD